jgi:hypothetical protein
MPFNGSGSFIPLSSPTYPAVADQPIYASQFNDNISDIHSGLGGCVTRDGQTTITANLPMAGFKFTGLGDGSSAGHALVYGQATAASLGGALAITGALSGVTTLATSGNATVGGTLGVTGAITGSAGVAVGGALTTATTGAFSSNVTVGGTLGVTGTASFPGGLLNAITHTTTASVSYTPGLTLESGAANTGEYSPALTFSASNVNSAIYSTRLSSFGGVLNFATQGTGGGAPVSRMTISEAGAVTATGNFQFSSSQAVCDGGGATFATSLPVGTIIFGLYSGSNTTLGTSKLFDGSNYLSVSGVGGGATLVQYGTWRLLGFVSAAGSLWIRTA